MASLTICHPVLWRKDLRWYSKNLRKFSCRGSCWCTRTDWRRTKDVSRNWPIRLPPTMTLVFCLTLTAPLWFKKMSWKRLTIKTSAHWTSRSKVASTSRIKSRIQSPRTVLSRIHSLNPCPNSRRVFRILNSKGPPIRVPIFLMAFSSLGCPTTWRSNRKVKALKFLPSHPCLSLTPHSATSPSLPSESPMALFSHRILSLTPSPTNLPTKRWTPKPENYWPLLI